ncbi:MAG: lysophospholipid acyltransferase family protein [Desulfovibrionaceae bacterium]
MERTACMTCDAAVPDDALALGLPQPPVIRLPSPDDFRSLWRIAGTGRAPAAKAVAAVLGKHLERLLGLDRINARYAAVSTSSTSATDFLRRSLDNLNIDCAVSGGVSRIPAQGPLVVVANHPFGCIEGIMLAALLTQARPDVKIMATRALEPVAELRDLFIFVDNFGGGNATRRNVGPLKECLRHLKNGGVLGVFPAGEVASINLAHAAVTDPAWSPTVAGLARRAKATVQPVFFDGANSALFHLLGLLHPRLRTAMLPRELLHKRDATLSIAVGNPIPPHKFASLDSDEALIDYLRLRTHMLRERQPRASRVPHPLRRLGAAMRPAGAQWAPSLDQPLIAPLPEELLAAEVDALPPQCRLARSKEFDVCCATADRIPALLREIGRLRERTFRLVGEGTGKPLDLDRFDAHYHHLFVWNREAREVVGAYRLGLTAEIMAAHGPDGLYTSTLFTFKKAFFDRLGPAIEMGRSFVRPKYQKHFAPLLLLWKGIGRFVCAHPEHSTLFGPVSISGDYSATSRELIVRHLRAAHRLEDLGRLVKAKTPLRLGALTRREVKRFGGILGSLDELTAVVTDLEEDGKSIPVLLRQYLKLGGALLAFNVDRAFKDCLDGLLVVDLLRTEPRTLAHYMGKEAMEAFIAHGHMPHAGC